MKNKTAERIKVTKKSLGILEEAVPVDMEAYYKRKVEEKKRDELRYKNEIAEESERIKKMKCPACSSVNKKRHTTSKNNGIIGPGYRSTILDDYYICQKCGIHYSDLNKKDIIPPSKNYF